MKCTCGQTELAGAYSNCLGDGWIHSSGGRPCYESNPATLPSSTPETDAEMTNLQKKLKAISVAIYIAVDETVARDISVVCMLAAEQLFELERERDEARREISDSLTKWTKTRAAILEPANCGVSGHFKFQENGGHCMMCQVLDQLRAELAEAKDELVKAGFAIGKLDTERDSLQPQLEALRKAIEEIRSANHNEFGCVSDSGIEAIICGLTATQGTK